jgi:hypothetical protein
MKRILALTLLVSTSWACGGGSTPADPATAQARVDSSLASDWDTNAPAAMDDLVAGVAESGRTLNDAYPDLPGHMPSMDTSSLPKLGDLIATLRHLIVDDSTYEGNGIYLVRGAAVCGADAACAANIDKVQLRLEVDVAGDGLDVTFLVGADRAAPITLRLRHDSLEADVSLSELAKAAADAGSTDLPSVLQGAVSAKIERGAGGVLTVTAAVTQPVKIATTGFALEVAARSPLARAVLDPTQHSADLTVDLGAVSLTAAKAALTIPGLSLHAVAKPGAVDADLDLRGTWSLSDDGKPLISLALTPLHIAVRPAPSGLPLFDFSPALAAHLQVLGLSYDLNVTPKVQVVPAGLRFVGGSFSLTAQPSGATLQAASGECLVADPLTVGEDPLIGHLAVRACP